MLTFDHIIIAVRDLDAATVDYRALGFITYYGGVHTHKNTHNALISLADGSYLELLAPNKMQSAALHPKDKDADIDGTIGILAQGEGFAGYALLATDLDTAAARLHDNGLTFDGPHPGHRTRYDGEPVAWQSINIAQTRTPFLIADETPHDIRVPVDATKVTHANGAQGVVGLVMAVNDLAATSARYEAILGIAPQHTSEIADAKTVDFALEGCTITLAAPLNDQGALAQHLAQFGEMPYQLKIRTTDAARTGLLDMTLAHGARIEFIP